MGMFDSVWADCPWPDCNGRVEWQSKVGPCDLNDHSAAEVPVAIAVDIDGEVSYCTACERDALIDAPSLPVRVQMRVKASPRR